MYQRPIQGEFFHLAHSVPRISSRSIMTLTRIQHLLKMNEWRYLLTLCNSIPVRSLWFVSTSMFLLSVWTRKKKKTVYTVSNIHQLPSTPPHLPSSRLMCLFDRRNMSYPLELQVTCHHVSTYRKQQLTHQYNKNQKSSVNKPLTVFNSMPAYSREPESERIAKCALSESSWSLAHTGTLLLTFWHIVALACLKISLLEFALSKSVYTESIGRFAFKPWDYIRSWNIPYTISFPDTSSQGFCEKHTSLATNNTAFKLALQYAGADWWKEMFCNS